MVCLNLDQPHFKGSVAPWAGGDSHTGQPRSRALSERSQWVMGIWDVGFICPSAQAWPTSFPLDDQEPPFRPLWVVPGSWGLLCACLGGFCGSPGSLLAACWATLLWTCHSWLWCPSNVRTSCLERRAKSWGYFCEINSSVYFSGCQNTGSPCCQHPAGL